MSFKIVKVRPKDTFILENLYMSVNNLKLLVRSIKSLWFTPMLIKHHINGNLSLL